ncbi:MAG: hypothetical protein AAFY60_07840, partial [Myxococcota bacterium]
GEPFGSWFASENRTARQNVSRNGELMRLATNRADAHLFQREPTRDQKSYGNTSPLQLARTNPDRVPSRAQSLARGHHHREEGVALVTFKKHKGSAYVSTSDVLDELLCFGWIDGARCKLDDDRS